MVSSSKGFIVNASKTKGKPFQDVTNQYTAFQRQQQHHHYHHQRNVKKTVTTSNNCYLPRKASQQQQKPQHQHHHPRSTATTTIAPTVKRRNNRKVLNPFATSVKQQQERRPQNPFEAVDIDKYDHSDPLAVTEYVDSIYQVLRKKEQKSDAFLLHHQPHFNNDMLSILIDWLLTIQHNEFVDYGSDSLFLTVNIIHRFLAKVVVQYNELQLVGVAAFLIATKYEEIWCPTVDELCYLCDDAYDEQDIIRMETLVLQTIQYDLSSATSYKFLQRFVKAAEAPLRGNNNDSDKDNKTTIMRRNIAQYILEGTLIHHNLQSNFLPSELAAASVLIAMKVTAAKQPHLQAGSHDSPWNFVLQHHTQYSESHLIGVAKAILLQKLSTPDHLQEVDKKYSAILSQSQSSLLINNKSFDSVLLWLKQQSMYFC